MAKLKLPFIKHQAMMTRSSESSALPIFNFCFTNGKEEVERDLHVLGVRRWRELATYRKKWRDIFREASAHSGLMEALLIG
jgi:hypothetical protein